MDSENTIFRVLDGLPRSGPPAYQFTHGRKGTQGEGLIVEVGPPGTTSWVGIFQRGLGAYSNIAPHPNGRDLVVVAGGQGYIVQRQKRTLVATFGGEVRGLWESPDGALIVFNDHDSAFSAAGVDGWRWKTRSVSSGGFDAIAIHGGRIEGRAWNVVHQCWQPFEVDLATGTVRGGANFEIGQQVMALDTEMRSRGGAPMSPLVKRTLEVLLGLLALALVLLSLYLTYDSIRSGELTWSRVIGNWGLAYFLLILTGAVLILGARLIFPSLGPNRRLLGPREIVVFFALYFAMLLISLWSSGVVPSAGLAVVVGVVGGFAYRRWG